MESGPELSSPSDSARISEPRPFTFAVGPRRLDRGYSRWVRWAKRGLPILAGVVIVLVIGWARLDPQDLAPQSGRVRISARDAEALTMSNPRYVGTDGGNRPFNVTAEMAAQSSPTEPRVELTGPKAGLQLQDDGSLNVAAARGAYDRERGTLELRGGVDMTHSQGYTLHTDAVDIDVKTGTAVSTAPVEGNGPAGRMSGQGMRIEQNGDIVKLTGRSSLLLRPAEARDFNAGGLRPRKQSTVQPAPDTPAPPKPVPSKPTPSKPMPAKQALDRPAAAKQGSGKKAPERKQPAGKKPSERQTPRKQQTGTAKP